MSPLTKAEARKLLVGRKVTISVGEPWDFTSSAGDNALDGRIVGVSDYADDPRDQWVELEVTPFVAEGGRTINRLVARRRYQDKIGIVEQIAAGKRADANLSYSRQVPEVERDPKSSPFLIGSVRLAEG